MTPDREVVSSSGRHCGKIRALRSSRAESVYVTFADVETRRAVAREVMRAMGREVARRYLAQQGEPLNTQ